jgi:hypothetical protein
MTYDPDRMTLMTQIWAPMTQIRALPGVRWAIVRLVLVAFYLTCPLLMPRFFNLSPTTPSCQGEGMRSRIGSREESPYPENANQQAKPDGQLAKVHNPTYIHTRPACCDAWPVSSRPHTYHMHPVDILSRCASSSPRRMPAMLILCSLRLLTTCIHDVSC